MDNRKLLNIALVAGAVAIIAALVGYLFFWPSDNTTACRNGKTDSGSSECRMMDEDGCMRGGMGGMMDSGMMQGGMMGGPTESDTSPLTIGQAEDAAKSYVDNYGNTDLKVKNVIEFANGFYARVEEQGSNTGAFELLINRNTGVVTPEPGPNMMWNTKYGSGAVGEGEDEEDDEDNDMMDGGSMDGMHEGMDSGSMDGMHSGTSDSSGMMDGGMCGMMGGGMMQGGMMNRGMMNNSNAQGNANATTDMPVRKAEARDRAQKYLDRQFPGAKAGEPVTYYGYYTVRVDKDDRTFGMLSVNGYYNQVWYHSWLGAYLSGKQL